MSNEGATRTASIWDWLWLIGCGLVSSAFCVSAATHLSATFDEPLYVRLGLEHWRTGSSFGLMRVGTMPLPVDVETAPVYIWERLRGEAFDPVADLARLLPVARFGNLAFWWLLLLYAWRIARQLAGAWGGRLAVAALVCEPNLLAHASLATTDVAVAACLLMFCWHYRQGRAGPWWQRLGIPTLCYAATILAKASGLVFVPICMLAIEGERCWTASEQKHFWPRLRDTLRGVFSRANRRDAIGMGLAAATLVFVYCGTDWKADPKFVAWAHGLPDGRGQAVAVWLAEHLCIFSNAGVGLWRQIQHNMKGHDGVYLLGQVAPRSVWYYFPVALTIKSSVPLLVLPVALAVFRRQALWNWVCIAAFALLVFSLNCRVQIGVRLVLPLLALASVGLAAAAINALRGLPRWQLRPGAGLAFGAVVWTAISTGSAWPHVLCYVNEIWGGAGQGYHLLSDSNFDWGQGLKELAAWQQRNEVAEIDVWYFGTDPAVKLPHFRSLPLHTLPIVDERQLAEHLHGRYFAAGTTVLFGSYCNDPRQQALLDGLRRRRPVALAGTFLVFDMQAERAALRADQEHAARLPGLQH